jgi:phosphate-selective porin OprO/OprP
MSRQGNGFWVGGAVPTLVALLGLAGPTGPALAADERTVNEQILDILVEQGTIDRDRYEELSRKAQAEKQLLARARAETEPTGWRAFWRDGIRIERNDGFVKLALGGRVQVDAAGASVEGSLEKAFPDAEGHGVDIRTARLFASGGFGEHGIFKSEFDFTGGDVAVDDVYVGLQALPFLGTVRLGHFKEPASLADTTSNRFTTFMERGLPVLAFAPGRNTGIGVNDQAFDERLTWSAGFFREVGSDGEGFSNSSEYNTTIRLTTLPVWEEEGRQLVHTGFWYSHKFRDDGPLQYDPDAESNTVGTLLEMPEILTDGVDVVGAELAFVLGPFSMQGEYIHSFVQGGSGQRDVDFYGNYVLASYVLTGERRPYDRKKGGFGRLRPRNPFSIAEGSFGAWELAGRWSLLDLNDQDVRGGVENNLTGGVNWYLYDNMRLMANYVLAHRNGIGDAHIVQSRVAVDF